MGSESIAISLGKIERRRAVDHVHQAIREAILDRRFPPRMRLNVEELASQLGVSLTPVRSAIQLLAAEGLVDVHSRSGTFVATLSRRDVEETFDIRCALECLAAEKAVEHLTDKDIERARRQFAVMSKQVKNDAQRKAHEQANSEFHEVIIRASGNQRLADMYESLQAHIAMCRLHRLDESWQSRLPQEQKEHQEIIEAMERRDAKALAKSLRSHILRAKDALLEHLEAAE
jgi:DNA-binding GntR family transcriptional regulator